MAFQNFYEMDVYKKCRIFRKDVSEIVKKHFPPYEKFLISAQILDASRSITANLAEGHGRFHYQENIQFCRVARGSMSETLEHLITAFDEGYITKVILEKMKKQYDDCLYSLNSYIAYLKRKKKDDK